jgi:hypothetical protein
MKTLTLAFLICVHQWQQAYHSQATILVAK